MWVRIVKVSIRILAGVCILYLLMFPFAREVFRDGDCEWTGFAFSLKPSLNRLVDMEKPKGSERLFWIRTIEQDYFSFSRSAKILHVVFFGKATLPFIATILVCSVALLAKIRKKEMFGRKIESLRLMASSAEPMGDDR